MAICYRKIFQYLKKNPMKKYFMNETTWMQMLSPSILRRCVRDAQLAHIIGL